MTETAPTQTRPSHQPAPKPAPPATLTTPRVSSSHSLIHVLHLHAVPPARPRRRAHSGTRAPRDRKPRTSRQKRRRKRRTRVHLGTRKRHDIARACHRTRGAEGKNTPRLPEPSTIRSERTTRAELEKPRPRSPDTGERPPSPRRCDHPDSPQKMHPAPPLQRGCDGGGAVVDLRKHRANRAARLRGTAKRSACTQQLRCCNSSEPCNRGLHERCSTR